MKRNLVKNCSAKRRLRHSLSSAITLMPSSCSASSFFTAVVVILLSCTLPSCSVLAFKAGHVEAVPGNTILRNPRPLPTGTSGGGSGGGGGSSGSNRNGNSFPPTGGGSRSAILMKLTSPRREFGGHVYEDPNVSHHLHQSQNILPSLSSPISSDLYAFSKSTESQQVQHDDDEHAPYVRFPTISSPFSSIQSSETHLHSHHQSPFQQRQQNQQQQQQLQTKSVSSKADQTPRQQNEQGRQQKPFAQSVSDLLAQHEEPSSLFGAGGIAPQEDDLLDSYYTTGSEDDVPLSSVDIDRYSSQEAAGDLFKKQTATPNTSTASTLNASSPSLASASSPAAVAVPTNSQNSVKTNSKSRSSSNSSFENHRSLEAEASSLASHHVLSKPTLLPLPANYLSLATFKQIDNTLEKSSSNILSRIANFWRNRTMSSHSSIYGTTVAVTTNKTAASSSNSNNNSKPNSHSSNSKSSSANNNYSKLARDSSIDADSDHRNHNEEETDTVFEKNLDAHDDNDGYVNRSGNNHRNNNNNNKDGNRGKNHRRQSESSSNRGSVQPTPKYISIEDLDAVSFGGGGAVGSSSFTSNSNQYLSLDDDEDDEGQAGVGEEDFATSTGGSTKEETHTTAKTTSTKTSSKQDNNLDADHFTRHHDHHSSSVEDYITSETTSSAAAAGLGLDDWLLGGEDSSAQSSHSFHDDLFHTTTGTITAVIDNSSSSSKAHPKKKDLVNSGSSRIERVHKSDSEKKASVLTSPSSGSGGASSSSSKADVKRAESDKIWSSIDSHFGRNDLIESAESEEEHDYYYGMTIGGFLKRELWTIPLFVLASLNMILIILFEVYVLCRARGTSRRHLFLGQMLLFGLFLCSFLALMFAVHPSIIGCFVGRLGVGITYSLIFSVLMVKCVFLLSLDTGVYLPTSYQGILLFFAVAVQVAVDTQWVIMYPPFLQTVESGRSVLLQCGTSFVQLLYSLSYVGFLILMVGFLAGRAAYKGVVENYREAVYILITAVVTVPVALSWTVAGWMLQGRHQDACVSFGLVAHSLTTFLIMFMPKGRQLASLEKEAVCFEDQEDQCSGYSPSFFHFKPTTKNYKTALWGDGNLYTTLEPTVSTINPNVFFHRNDFHSGMIY